MKEHNLLQTSRFDLNSMWVLTKDIHSLTDFRGDEQLRVGAGTNGTSVVTCQTELHGTSFKSVLSAAAQHNLDTNIELT